MKKPDDYTEEEIRSLLEKITGKKCHVCDRVITNHTKCQAWRCLESIPVNWSRWKPWHFMVAGAGLCTILMSLVWIFHYG